MSSNENLQTLTLGSSSEADNMATISLSEIGGIPNSKPMTQSATADLTCLSPEALNNIISNSLQFLNCQNDTNVVISSDYADVSQSGPLDSVSFRSSSANSQPTYAVSNTQSIKGLRCLPSGSPGRATVSCSPASTGKSVISESLRAVEGIMDLQNEDLPRRANTQSHMSGQTVSLSVDDDFVGPHTTLNLFEASIDNQSRRLGDVLGNATPALGEEAEDSNLVAGSQLNKNSQSVINSKTISISPSQQRYDNEQTDENHRLQHVAHLFKDSTSEACKAISKHLSNPGVTTGREQQNVDLSQALITLPGPLSSDSLSSGDAPPTHPSTFVVPGDSETLQVINLSPPNVMLTQSGQVVISQVSMLQGNQFVPLVSQQATSQASIPDSTSDIPQTKQKNKGGWPKGRKRKFDVLEAAKAPKAPTTSYMLFFKEKKESLQHQIQGLSHKDLVKIISSLWASLPDEDKKFVPKILLGGMYAILSSQRIIAMKRGVMKMFTTQSLVYTDKAAKLRKQHLADLKEYHQSEACQTVLRSEAANKVQDLKEINGFCGRSQGAEEQEDLVNSIMEASTTSSSSNELYCQICNQYFITQHNKKEHMSGKNHIKKVAEKLVQHSQKKKETAAEEIRRREIDKEPNLQSIKTDLMTLHAGREEEISELRREATISILRNIELNKEFKDLQESVGKLKEDLKNLKGIETSLSMKVDGLKMVPTLFGVISF